MVLALLAGLAALLMLRHNRHRRVSALVRGLRRLARPASICSQWGCQLPSTCTCAQLQAASSVAGTGAWWHARVVQPGSGPLSCTARLHAVFCVSKHGVAAGPASGQWSHTQVPHGRSSHHILRHVNRRQDQPEHQQAGPSLMVPGRLSSMGFPQGMHGSLLHGCRAQRMKPALAALCHAGTARCLAGLFGS